VGSLGLGKAAVGFLLGSMNQVGEFHRILNKKNRNIVANDVPVALFGVELDSKTPHIARHVRRTLAARHSGKSHKGRGFFALALEDIGAGDVLEGIVGFKIAMGAVTPGMYYPFGDSLMVKMKDLVAQNVVFQQGRAAHPRLEGVLVIGNGRPLLGGKDIVYTCSLLV